MCIRDSPYLKKGQNQMKIELGNGMYNPSPLRLFGKYNLRERLSEVGEPKVLCDLVSCNQVILSSDASWKQGEGPVSYTHLFINNVMTPVIPYQDNNSVVYSKFPSV